MTHPSPQAATLGGGCFWCLEAVFELVDGVQTVRSGYAGGDVPNPDYRTVCTGRTGHAEVVQVQFDPTVIPYPELLGIFFATHDPTTLNRQGADAGSQYRSIILYHDDTQREDATALIADLDRQHIWASPIVTEVAPFEVFYPAEAEHAGYYRRHRDQPYCRAVIDPKVATFRQRFAHRLRPAGASPAPPPR